MQYRTHIAIASALLGAVAISAGCSAESSARAESAAADDRPPTVADQAVVEAEAPPPRVITEADEPAVNDDGDTEPASLGSFELTYYWMAEEDEGEATVPLFHYKTCKPIAKVTKSFARKLAVEGTGRLADGRVINTAGGCKCDKDGACFFVVSKRKKWGVGVGKKPLAPFRTVAVDPSMVAIGSLLYIPELDGLTVPGRKPWGGFVHDGCVVAGDRGGGVEGAQLDFFMGRKRHYRSFFGRNRLKQVTVVDGSTLCEKRGREVARANRNSI